MTRMRAAATLLVAVSWLVGCEKPAEEAEAAGPPAYVPDLPKVPQLPPPPHPVTYGDESYSVYGLRRRIRQTVDTDVSVTAYIVDVYEAPPCTKKKKEECPVAKAPHIWVADTVDEEDRTLELIVVGYAINQEEVDYARKHPKRKLAEGEIAIPTDFAKGNKVKLHGTFQMVSGGFNSSNGLLEYKGHETLEKAGG